MRIEEKVFCYIFLDQEGGTTFQRWVWKGRKMLTETLRVGLMTALITVSRCASSRFVFASSVITSLALECQRRY